MSATYGFCGVSASSPTAPVSNRRFLTVTESERSANGIGRPEHGRHGCLLRLSGQRPRAPEVVDRKPLDLAEDLVLRYLLYNTGRWSGSETRDLAVLAHSRTTRRLSIMPKMTAIIEEHVVTRACTFSEQKPGLHVPTLGAVTWDATCVSWVLHPVLDMEKGAKKKPFEELRSIFILVSS